MLTCLSSLSVHHLKMSREEKLFWRSTHDTAVKLSLRWLSLHLGWPSYLSEEEEGVSVVEIVTSDIISFAVRFHC